MKILCSRFNAISGNIGGDLAPPVSLVETVLLAGNNYVHVNLVPWGSKPIHRWISEMGFPGGNKSSTCHMKLLSLSYGQLAEYEIALAFPCLCFLQKH